MHRFKRWYYKNILKIPKKECDRIFEAQWSKKYSKSHRCPKCGCVCVDIDGTKAMECSVCHKVFKAPRI